MNKQEIADKLRELVCEGLNVEPHQITDDASVLDDLGADSLDLVDLAMQIETAMGIEIPDTDFEKLVRFKSAVEYIETKRAQRESSETESALPAATELGISAGSAE